MNPLLKRILIIIGVILAVLAIGALVFKGVSKTGKWNKKHDCQSEQSSCCKCCSSDDDDDDDDEDEEAEEDADESKSEMKKNDKKD